MRILLTNTGPWGTGSFSFADALLHDLERLGHKVKLFFPDAGGESNPQYEDSERYAIWRFPITDGRATLESFPCFLPEIHPRSTTRDTFRSLSEEQLALYFSALRKELSPLLTSFAPDIIECQHIWSIQKIIADLGYPYLCTAHNSDQIGFDYDLRMRPILLAGAAGAEQIITLTEKDKQEVAKLYAIPPEKIEAIPFGYDPDFFHYTPLPRKEVLGRWQLPIPDGAPIVTFIGHMTRLKGADLLTRAIQQIRNREAHFVFIGKGSLSDLFSQEELAELDLSRIHLTGFKPHKTLPEILSISHLFVLPSRSEGFGVSCLEAMSCGIPAIFPTNTGLVEYGIGRSFTNGDAFALQEALDTLLDLPVREYTALAKKAREAAANLSRPALAKRRIELYQNCMRKSPRRRPAV